MDLSFHIRRLNKKGEFSFQGVNILFYGSFFIQCPAYNEKIMRWAKKQEKVIHNQEKK